MGRVSVCLWVCWLVRERPSGGRLVASVRVRLVRLVVACERPSGSSVSVGLVRL